MIIRFLALSEKQILEIKNMRNNNIKFSNEKIEIFYYISYKQDS